MTIYISEIDKSYVAKVKNSNNNIYINPANGEATEAVRMENGIIRAESQNLYGLIVKDTYLYFVANGVEFACYSLKYIDDYSHLIRRKFDTIENSGIEIETNNFYSSLVVWSLINYFSDEANNPSHDSSLDSGGYEFKITLRLWNKIIDYIKPSLVFASTHVHVSEKEVLKRLLYEYENGTMKLPEDPTPFWGRNYTSYARKGATIYTKDRYAAITLPAYSVDYDSDIYSIDSIRVTAEFRICRLVNKDLVRNFINFLYALKDYTFNDALNYAYEDKIPNAKAELPVDLHINGYTSNEDEIPEDYYDSF